MLSYLLHRTLLECVLLKLLTLQVSSPFQKSNCVHVYSELLKNPDCLSNNSLIAQSNVFYPALIKSLEKIPHGEIIKVLSALIPF